MKLSITTCLVSLSLLAVCRTGMAAELSLATGPPGRTYEKIGRALKAAFEDAGSSVELRLAQTDGTYDNMRLLLSGEVDLALTQCNVLYAAYTGSGEFAQPHHDLRMVSMLNREAIQVIAHREAGHQSVLDLRGKKVAFDRHRNGWMAFEALGFSASDVEIVSMPVDQILDSFVSGDVDAFVAVGAVPHPPVVDAVQNGGVVLPLAPGSEGGEAWKRIREYVDLRTYLHLDDVDLAGYGRNDTMKVISVDGALVCLSALDDALGHETARILADSQGAIAGAHPTLADYEFRATSELSPIPMQAGALRYVKKAGLASYPVHVHVGVYLYSISELDLSKGTYLLDGYIWFRWRGPLLDEEDFQFVITNGQIEQLDDAPIRRENGWNRQSRRFTATGRKNFVLYDYPFDTQVLPLEIEHRFLGTERLIFVPDEVAVAADLGVSDWLVRDVSHEVRDKTYETQFGSIDADWSGTSSRYVCKVVLERRITPYLIKTVLPLMIVVTMSFLVFFISPQAFDVQAGIVVTALLTCVALHMSQADALPQVGYLVKADKFFILAYAVIFLALVETVLANRLFSSDRKKWALRIDRISCWVFPVVFFVPIGYLILSS